MKGKKKRKKKKKKKIWAKCEIFKCLISGDPSIILNLKVAEKRTFEKS